MRTKTALILLTAIIVNSFFMADATALEVSAKSAVLMCADSGQVLYAKNAEQKLSMASTTKIMTALLAVEKLPLDGVVTVGDEVQNVEGTSLGLLPGDTLTVFDLISGLMLASGNDAANAVAVAVSGSVDAFVGLMNEKANRLGMVNTVFATPSGLDAEAHYSTAYDMALLTIAALQNDAFSGIVSCSGTTIQISDRTVWLTNHNRLLKSYDGLVGVKTGFTKKSGRCLVTAAERDGRAIVAVTLSAPDDWNDHRELLDYGFTVAKQFSAVDTLQCYYADVVGAAVDKVSCSPGDTLSYTAQTELTEFSYTVCLSPFLYAPVEKGSIVGKLLVYSGDIFVGEVPLCANEYVERLQKTPQQSLWKRLLIKWIGWFTDG